jgi:hypothetical protein
MYSGTCTRFSASTGFPYTVAAGITPVQTHFLTSSFARSALSTVVPGRVSTNLCAGARNIDAERGRRFELGLRRWHARVIPPLRHEVVHDQLQRVRLLLRIRRGVRVLSVDHGAAEVAAVVERREREDDAVEQGRRDADGGAPGSPAVGWASDGVSGRHMRREPAWPWR